MIRSLFICASLIGGASLFAQKDVIHAQWISQSVKVDGNDSDWKKPFNYFDEKSRIQYAVANDDKNMYLCFQCPDPTNQVKIMRAGMQVTLSTKGKNKRESSISFPLEQFSDPTPAASSDGTRQRPDVKQMRNRFLAGSTTMTTAGFATRNGMISVRDSAGLNVAMNWDTSNVMIYEIAIPLKELLGAPYTVADLTKEMTLDVQIRALEQPHHSGGGGDSGFSGGGHGGGRMGGGGGGGSHMGGGHRHSEMGGGQEGPGHLDRSALFEKTEFKHKIVLMPAKS